MNEIIEIWHLKFRINVVPFSFLGFLCYVNQDFSGIHLIQQFPAFFQYHGTHKLITKILWQIKKVFTFFCQSDKK